MLAKLSYLKQQLFAHKTQFYSIFNWIQRCRKILRGDLISRDHTVKAEDVCCTLDTRKIQGRPCIGPQECYLEPTTIKLLIHGWPDTKFSSQYKHLVQQYLQKENYNVIRVDWSQQAELGYIKSVQSSVSIGKLVGRFLIRLLNTRITTHEKIHIIGHSLGAHIAGIAGKEVTSVTGKKIGRITALDPSKLFFEVPSCSPEVRLKNTDASMVDVTHTDCLMFGYKRPLGTVDFYVNGIGFQPGFRKQTVMTRFTNIKELGDYIFASHRRSCKCFTDSINNRKMIGWRCKNFEDVGSKICDMDSSIIYGENTPDTAKGLYFVRTTSD